MKTYTAYSVVRGVAVTLAFLTIGLPILVFFSSSTILVGLSTSFFCERSFAAFWDTFSYWLKDYWQDVKGSLGDLGVFSFHV